MLILVGKIFGKSPKSQTQKPSQESIQATVKQFSNQLPEDPNQLVKEGWKDVTHPEQAKLGQREFQHPTVNLKVDFHPGDPRKTKGSEGSKDHYHIHNPNRTGKRDHYLDIQGNPTARGSRVSHIHPSLSISASTQFQSLQELKQNTTVTTSENLPSQSPNSARKSPSPKK